MFPHSFRRKYSQTHAMGPATLCPLMPPASSGRNLFPVGFTAREMITLNLGLGIATQNFYRVRKLVKIGERGNGIGILQRRLQVEIKTIAPRSAGNGAALNL